MGQAGVQNGMFVASLAPVLEGRWRLQRLKRTQWGTLGFQRYYAAGRGRNRGAAVFWHAGEWLRKG